MSRINKTATTALLAMLSLGYSLSGVAVEFATGVSYPVGTAPAAVAMADFNGDGKPDVAVVNSGSGDVSVLLNNGDGTYKPAVNFDAGMASPASVDVADFNHDGFQDLAIWSLGDAAALSILLGNGDGTFRAAQTTPLSGGADQTASGVALGDFNLDHQPDVAVLVHDASGNGDAKILLLDGNGDGTLQAPKEALDLLTTVVGSVLVAADFNNDTKADLAIQVSGGVEILLGRGDGTFQSGTTIAVAHGAADALKVGDFNGDNKVDLLVRSDQRYTKNFSHVTDYYISLFSGNGDGSFQPEELIQTTEEISSALSNLRRGRAMGVPAVGDFNGDGESDLAYAVRDYDSHPSASPGIRLARGDGSFSALLPLDGPNPDLLWSSLVARDVNGDRLADLIFPDAISNAVVVELNATPTNGADLGIIEASASGAQALSYSAFLLNEGPRGATDVTFTDTLPGGVSFDSASATQGSCSQSHGVVTCDIGSLASASDVTVTISVNVPAAMPDGVLSNRMNVTANEQDGSLANNSAEVDISVLRLTVATAGTGSGTVVSEPAGISCGAMCSQAYVSGATVSLVPTASPGFVFAGWSGDCDSQDPNGCTVTMDSDKSMTAMFNTPSTPDGSGGGPGSGGGGGGLDILTLWSLLTCLFLVGRKHRVSDCGLSDP
jgi:uncharacterized repeat protein (TIGR01451 family)